MEDMRKEWPESLETRWERSRKELNDRLGNLNTDDFETNEGGGVKETSVGGKPKTMFQLIDPVFEEGFADILTMGAIKYAPDNWQKVDPDQYYRATGHHWNEYRKGNKIDEESGLSHLYHIACNIMFLDWFDRNSKE